MRPGVDRSRAPAVQIFEDTNTPPLRQARFPNRRHHSSSKTPTVLTPMARWKQQTLTRLTPTLSHATSSHDSSFESDDLRYDSLEAMMPPKKRSRKSSKHLPDQQTITQMDPFKLQLYPEEDTTVLEKEHTLDLESPPRRKKRKASSVGLSVTSVQTRSAKKRAAATKAENGKENKTETFQACAEHGGQAVDTPLQINQRSATMPPPKTPKTTRRKEVPSSQSPADTPWSARSNWLKNQSSASPLKERPINTPSRICFSSQRKSAHAGPQLEIGDSIATVAVDEENNQEHEEDAGATKFLEATRDSSATKTTETDPSMRLGTPLLGSNPVTSKAKSLTGKTFLSQRSDRKLPPPPALKRSGTIADSLEESHESLGTEPGCTYQLPCLETMSPTDRSGKASLSINCQGESHVKSASSSNPVDKDLSFESIPTQLQSQRAPDPKATPLYKTPSLRGLSQQSSSNADQPSARVGNGLLEGSSPARVHRAPILETESQFEDAWREYTPPSLDYGSSQSDRHQHDEDDIIPQPPEPPLPTPQRAEALSQQVRLPPVPPSQATTVDITQSSPHRPSLQQGSSGLLIQTASPQPSQRQQSQLLSSPLLDRKAAEVGQDSYMGYQGWNGVRMTDSQLLPASLLDDGPELPAFAEDEELYRAENSL
ncbi:MAG: hypothetical protein Q9174_004423 [Haloplaca sp. 1 TL-2023]